jgi:hypothetical protein
MYLNGQWRRHADPQAAASMISLYRQNNGSARSRSTI